MTTKRNSGRVEMVQHRQTNDAAALARKARRACLASAIQPCLEVLEGRRLLSAGTINYGPLDADVRGFQFDYRNGTATQADGKLLVAGYVGTTGVGNGRDVAVARYNTNGTIDSSYGTGGVAVLGLSGDQEGKAISIDTSGRACVAVTANNAGVRGFAAARFTTGGVADSSFAGTGYSAINFNSGNENAWAIGTRPDGRIVVGGSAQTGSGTSAPYNFAIAQFTTAGALDTTFGSGGKISDNAIAGNSDQVTDLSIQPDGKVVVAGTSNGSATADGTNFAVKRYTSTGSVDGGFHGGTAIIQSFGAGTVAAATGIALQTDGKIVALGSVTANPSGSEDLGVARYTSSGALDTSFSGDGLATVNFTTTDRPGAIAVETLASSQKIVISGSTGSNGSIEVARFNLDGSLDTSFNTTGKETIPVTFAGHVGVERTPALAIQNLTGPYKSNILVAGVDTSDNLIMASIDGNSATNNATPDTVWVNDDWSITNDVAPAGLSTGDTVYDAPTNISAVYGIDGFNTIQNGINAVTAGGTVDVLAGTYKENPTANKAVNLIGANSGVAGSASRGLESIVISNGNQNSVFSITSNNVTINGFTIDGDDPSTNGGNALTSGEDANVLYGIRPSSNQSNIDVQDNIIKHAAIGFRGDGVSQNNVITANWFDSIGAFDFGYAISLRTNYYADVTNNLMTRVQSGLHYSNHNGTGGPAQDLFTGNTVTTYGAGVWDNLGFNQGSPLTISGNTISGLTAPHTAANDTADTRINYDGNSTGIMLTSLQDNVGVTITNNSLTSLGYGVVMWNTSGANTPTLSSSNIINNNGTGVYVANVVGFNPVSRTTLGGTAPNGAWSTNHVTGVTRAIIDNATLSGNTTGVKVNGDPAEASGATVEIRNNTNINGGTTGVSVSGSLGSANIHDNSNSISGNAGVGVDVTNNSSATITNDHIYNNGTGVRLTTGGTASVSNDNFDGGANPDNLTDIRLDSTAGTLTFGNGNVLAGDTYFIDNRSPQAFDLTTNTSTFDESNNFRIEDKLFHAPDSTLSGLIRVVANNIFITAPGTGANDESIQNGVTAASPGDTVNVESGTFDEDVTIGKSLILSGAGQATTTITGPIGGSGSTVAIAANNVEVKGFKITRDGNNTTDWNNPNTNTVGVSWATGVTGVNLHDNHITQNRSGVDINNSSGNSVHNNVIDDNNTGIIFRNVTNNEDVEENSITNNRTLGVLFLDASGGTNSPLQQALNCTFTNNDISGNWYGQIVDRQTGGSLPAPGSNLKNFSGNWLGTATPVITSANSTEPGYATHIPVEFGGSDSAPGGQPDVAGQASANFDITPLLGTGVDTNVETTPGRGTYGFQGNYNNLHVLADLAQTGGTGRISEGVADLVSGGTLHIHTGTYTDNVDTSSKSVVVAPGASPGQVTLNGNITLDSNDSLQMELNGTNAATQYDNFIVSGTVTLGNSTLSLTRGFAPFPGDSFTIVDKITAGAVVGNFAGDPEGTTINVAGIPLTLTYQGGDGNDIVLSVAQPNTVWVDDTWVEASNTSGGTPGVVEPGDIVDSNPGAGDTSVTGKTFGFDAFATIQDAVNAVAAGGTVNIIEGSYAESNILVPRSETIHGLSRTNVVVSPAGADGHVNDNFTSAQNGFVIGASNVSIDHLTLDGGASQNYRNGIITNYTVADYGNIDVNNVTVNNIFRKGVAFYVTDNNKVTGDSVTNSSFDNVATNPIVTFEAGFAIAAFQSDTDISNVQITHSGAGIGTNYFTTDADSPLVHISNVQFSSPTRAGSNKIVGIDLSGAANGSSVTGSTVNTNVAGAQLDAGIVVQYAATNADVTVSGDTVTGGNGDVAIFLYQDASVAHPVLVSNNTLNGVNSAVDGVLVTDDGQYFGESPHAGVTYATITGNTMSGFDNNAGVSVEAGGGTASATVGLAGVGNGNTITGNQNGVAVVGGQATITNNNISVGLFGVELQNQGAGIASATISGNILDAQITGVSVMDGHATISGNDIHNSSSPGFGGGVEIMSGAAASVDNNTFGAGGTFDTDLALDFGATVDAGTITGNTFSASNYFIDQMGTQNISALVSAGNVYSGAANNFRIEDKIHHRMDADQPLSTGLVTWVAGNLYVTNPAVNPVSTDSSIQRGVDSATAGNTVNVEDGTYTRAGAGPNVVLINKSLTLKGANAGVDANGVRGPESIIDGNSAGENYYVVEIEADNVTMDGFTVTNPLITSSVDATGILVGETPSRHSNVHITNNIVHDIGQASRTPVSFGTFGIESGPVNGIEIDHNLVYNLANADASASAIGIFTWGNDNVDNADNVNIHHNVVHDISNPTASEAAGIWTGSDSSNVIVDHNTVTNAGVGIHASAGMDTAAAITNNTVGGGIISAEIEELHGGSTVTGNTLTGTMPTDGKRFNGAASYAATITSVYSNNTMPTGVLVHDSSNVYQSSIWANIQGGDDAANNTDTVIAKTGNYFENVVIDKEIELLGDGQANTKVYPSFIGANTGGGSLAPGSSNVLLVQANNVNIHDLTVNGDNPNLTSGIVAHGADIDARNGIITNHNAGTFNNLSVHDVTVKNIYLRGIYASSGGSFNFTNDTVDNVDADPGSVAIFNFGGSGIIQGCTVSNAADAISANHSTGTQFLNNVVTSSGSGIHTDNNGDGGGTADVITGNQVSNGTAGSYGIWVFFPYLNTVNVANNTVTNVDVGLAAFGGGGGSSLFNNNNVDIQNRAGGVAAYVTTDTLGFGQFNVSTSFTNNTLKNAPDTGLQSVQNAGATVTLNVDSNQLTGDGKALDINGTTSPLNVTNNTMTGTGTGPGVTISNVSVLNYTNNTLTGFANGGSFTNDTTINYTPTTNANSDTFILDATTMQDNANQAISYSGVTTLNVYTLDGNDQVTVQGAGAGLTTWVDTGNGTDTVTWVGSANDDNVTFITSPTVGPAFTSTESVYYTAGSQRVNMLNEENRRILTLGGNDNVVYARLGGSVATGFDIETGSGNDSVTGGLGNDTILGGDGNDRLDGANGDDSIDGGNDNDTLYGGIGNDVLITGTGENQAYGQNGNDTIFASNGGLDFIDGGAGFDIAHADPIDLLNSIEQVLP